MKDLRAEKNRLSELGSLKKKVLLDLLSTMLVKRCIPVGHCVQLHPFYSSFVQSLQSLGTGGVGNEPTGSISASGHIHRHLAECSGCISRMVGFTRRASISAAGSFRNTCSASCSSPKYQSYSSRCIASQALISRRRISLPSGFEVNSDLL